MCLDAAQAALAARAKKAGGRGHPKRNSVIGRVFGGVARKFSVSSKIDR